MNWKEVKKAGKKDVEEQDPVPLECELRSGWKNSQAKQTAKETGDNSTRAEEASNRLEGAWEEDILQMGSRQDTTSAVPVYSQRTEGRASRTEGRASSTEGRASASIMKVTHTPLLDPSRTLYTGQSKLDVPGAGIKYACGYQDTAKNVHTTPDIRKAVKLHGSPNPEIHLSRSSMLVHGRIEMFGVMSEMVEYWNAKEEEDGDDGKVTKEEGGRRRSRRIGELCEIFEGGVTV